MIGELILNVIKNNELLQNLLQMILENNFNN